MNKLSSQKVDFDPLGALGGAPPKQEPEPEREVSEPLPEPPKEPVHAAEVVSDSEEDIFGNPKEPVPRKIKKVGDMFKADDSDEDVLDKLEDLKGVYVPVGALSGGGSARVAALDEDLFDVEASGSLDAFAQKTSIASEEEKAAKVEAAKKKIEAEMAKAAAATTTPAADDLDDLFDFGDSLDVKANEAKEPVAAAAAALTTAAATSSSSADLNLDDDLFAAVGGSANGASSTSVDDGFDFNSYIAQQSGDAEASSGGLFS